MGLESTRRRRTLGDHFNAQWCTARLRVRSILVFLSVNNLPDALEALMLLFAKNGDLPDTEHMSSQFSYYSMRMVEEIGHADQSCSVQLTLNWAMYSISLPSALILLIK